VSQAVRTKPPSTDGFDRRLIAPLIAGAVLNPINSTIVSVALCRSGWPSANLRRRPRG